MISLSYAQLMAAHNAEMNRRVSLHRGQALAMLTAAGETTSATDLPTIFAG